MLKSIATLSALRREEQFQAERTSGIGGSDVGAICGTGSFGCPRRLWYQKRETPPDFPKEHRAEFDRGHYLEPVVKTLYEQETGRIIGGAPSMRHPDFPFILGHVDGIIDAIDERGPGVFEAKTCNRFVWNRFKKEGIRDEYLLQMQHYLLASGFKWGSFAILCVDPWNFAWFDVDRDDALCQAILSAENVFWGEVENGPCPQPLEDVKDKRCASCEFRRTCRGDSMNPESPNSEPPKEGLTQRPELTPLLTEIQELATLRDEATELYEEARGKLKAEIGDAYGLIAGGFRALYPVSFPERWDTKALQALVDEAKKALEYSPIDYVQLEMHVASLIALLKGFIKAKKPAKPERSLRIYATGD